MLVRSEKGHKENNYLEYITNDTTNEIQDKINDIRKQLINITSYLKRKN